MFPAGYDREVSGTNAEAVAATALALWVASGTTAFARP
jgi:hypothetical protein